MYYTIYKTTNLLDGKFYIGMHKTNNLEDGYIGSGKILRRAIKKHGLENFRKDILFVFNTQQDMIDKEIELITEELVKNPASYNLTVGGWGGNRITDSNHRTHSLSHMKEMSVRSQNAIKTDPLVRARHRKTVANNLKTAHASGKIRYDTFTGRYHSDESKEKMSNTRKGTGTGEQNSQFGTMWITNGIINKKIKINMAIPEGFRKGKLPNALSKTRK